MYKNISVSDRTAQIFQEGHLLPKAKVFKERVDLVLRDVVLWAILVLAEWLNILQVFSGLHDSIVVCK